MEQLNVVIEHFIGPFTGWQDVVDVLLVALVLYNLLLLIRGTREVQIVLGLVILVVFYYASRLLEMEALETTLENFFLILPVAIVVLFQREIRRALARFGSTSLLNWSDSRKVVSAFNELVLACTTLAERRIGALIVIERLEGLRNYVENGILIDGMVSLDLLINLFTPNTPTHDGAVILQSGRLAAATCFLPLTQNPELSKEFGTRHRAALGISEETDALVVSEETGVISVAIGGQMHRPLESNELRGLLYKYLVTDLAAREVTL